MDVEQMQPDWLPKKQRLLYRLSVALTFALIFVPASVLFGSILGLLFFLYSVLFLLISSLLDPLFGMEQANMLGSLVIGVGLIVIGLIVALIFALKKIQPVESLSWSWKKAFVTLTFVLLFALINILVLLVLSGAPLINVVVLWGLFSSLFFTPPIILVGGWTKRQLTERLSLSPNEGIHRSAKSGLFFGLASVVIGELMSVALSFSTQSFGGASSMSLVDVTLNELIFWWLPIGLAIGLVVGLGAAVQHYILRFWLWRAHLFPLNAVHFLDDATSRILLRRVGGGYNFVHRLLLDYFASQESRAAATRHRNNFTLQTSLPIGCTFHPGIQ